MILISVLKALVTLVCRLFEVGAIFFIMRVPCNVILSKSSVCLARDMSDSRHMTRTITIQETQTEMGYPSVPSAGASSATKELDDLMASLSDFKVSEGIALLINCAVLAWY